jgi:hypothetical protein
MRAIFLFISLFTGVVLFAQKHVLYDSSNISARSFSKNDLQKFENDKDFQYERSPQLAPNLWVRFWRWVWWKFAEIMSTSTWRGTVYTSAIIIAAVVLIYFVLQVMGMSKSDLLARSNTGNAAFTTFAEDIHHISFEDAISDAVQARNFRLAIRLLYLHSLKQLSDKGYIVWQLNKSNADFLKEVAQKPWHSLFRKLTYSFEHCWYGEMHIDNEEFDLLNTQFQQFNNQLR